ncbi:MAG: hypothetical protein HFF02_01865 [Erysipelotrichaceae bacterium]|nr:hypothetical protein [Erysipelotrichaceae bacterium]
MCRRSKSTMINHIRLELINKGYLTVKDIQRFVPCGYQKAKMMKDDIVSSIQKEKKKIHPMGIPTYRLIVYLDMNENEIRRNVEDERNRIAM